MRRRGVRKIRWWQKIFDPAVRSAIRRKNETTHYQTVDYTESGIAITMPAEIADQWDAMPAQVREEFMASIEAQMSAGGFENEHHEWIGG